MKINELLDAIEAKGSYPVGVRKKEARQLIQSAFQEVAMSVEDSDEKRVVFSSLGVFRKKDVTVLVDGVKAKKDRVIFLPKLKV